MGYFTNACLHCNMDDPDCMCRCHSVTMVDIHEGDRVGCNSD